MIIIVNRKPMGGEGKGRKQLCNVDHDTHGEGCQGKDRRRLTISVYQIHGIIRSKTEGYADGTLSYMHTKSSFAARICVCRPSSKMGKKSIT